MRIARIISVLVVSLSLFVSILGCVEHPSEQVRVITTTSLIGSMVRAIGANTVCRHYNRVQSDLYPETYLFAKKEDAKIKIWLSLF